MARMGFSYKEILSFYYPGSYIAKGVDVFMANKTVTASYQVEKFIYMADNKWKYVAKAAEKGKVDCSGAFTYWYKQADSYMYHGSNTMWRKYAPTKGQIGKIKLVPGMAVYKHRNDGKEPSKFKEDGLGNFYHVGQYIGNGKVVEAKGTKYGVVYSDIEEWSHCSTLKYTEYDMDEDGMIPPAIVFPVIGVVSTNSGRLNVRQDPSTSSEVIAKLEKGERVVLEDKNGDWFTITVDGQRGYISSSYVTVTEDRLLPTHTITFTLEDEAMLSVILDYLKDIGITPHVSGD